ncbi:MAG: hypothetical protein M3Y73_12790 [Actinomycetota bacterium]|nr:hypothetical protein [Actinomycetota bacterium]
MATSVSTTEQGPGGRRLGAALDVIISVAALPQMYFLFLQVQTREVPGK